MLLKADGLGLVSRAEMAAKMGADKLQAAETLGQALAVRNWGQKDLMRNKRATERLIDQLQPHRAQREVSDFLTRVAKNPAQVDSRELHYMQRRYIDGLHLDSMADMDRLYERILSDRAATVQRKGGIRYTVRSPSEEWIAVLEPNGTRVSLFPDLGDDLGETLWTLETLIA